VEWKSEQRGLEAAKPNKYWLKRTWEKQVNSAECRNWSWDFQRKEGGEFKECGKGNPLGTCTQIQWLIYNLLVLQLLTWTSHLALLLKWQFSYAWQSYKNHDQFYLRLLLLHREKHRVLCCFSGRLFFFFSKEKRCLLDFSCVKNDLKLYISVHRKIAFHKENPGIKYRSGMMSQEEELQSGEAGIEKNSTSNQTGPAHDPGPAKLNMKPRKTWH